MHLWYVYVRSSFSKQQGDVRRDLPGGRKAILRSQSFALHRLQQVSLCAASTWKETLYNAVTECLVCFCLFEYNTLLITRIWGPRTAYVHLLLLLLLLTSPSCTQGLNYFWQTDQLLRTPVLKSAMSNTMYFRYSRTAPLMLWEDASVSCYFYAAFIERERRAHHFYIVVYWVSDWCMKHYILLSI